MKTSECVSPMHPDKICDRISDAILDTFLSHDATSRCAVEVMGGHGKICITGEIKSQYSATMDEYKTITNRICTKEYDLQVNIDRQSPEIAAGVDKGGAGDQGIMVGYACDENSLYIPNEHYFAKKLCKYIYEKKHVDGKTQITMDDKKIVCVVASFCGISSSELHTVVHDCLKENLNNDCNILLNNSGDWNIGGFDADTGVTGRKIVVDAYGPRVPVGGGAFSGKDATKLDRSGAYKARQLAKRILLEKNAHEVYVYVSYVIGGKAPLDVQVIMDGKSYDETARYSEECMPENIIRDLDLLLPIYEETAEWGAFGEGFLWDTFNDLKQ